MPRDRSPVFDEAPRHDPLPQRHTESTFAFYNRIAGPYWQHPRHLIQTWADHIGDDKAYADLRGRFRCGDDYTFRSAFLELYLHEALLAAGYTVTVHPAVSGVTQRPDLHAERDGEEMYVEAILPGASQAAKASANRRNDFLQTIDNLESPDFYLMLEHLQEGTKPPSGAALRKELRTWLRSLDPDGHGSIEDAPIHRWSQDGWATVFRALPKPPTARRPSQAGDRSIGVYAHQPVSLVDDAPTIRNALTSKHHAYGDLHAPFVIAVGQYTFDEDRHHATNALYGTAAIRLRETPGGLEEAGWVRHPDGYFGAPPAWANRHVSGVLLVNQLQPHSVTRAEATLWHHPGPLHQLHPGHELPWTDARLAVDHFDITGPARPPARHFGLPTHWPPGQRWPRG